MIIDQTRQDSLLNFWAFKSFLKRCDEGGDWCVVRFCTSSEWCVDVACEACATSFALLYTYSTVYMYYMTQDLGMGEFSQERLCCSRAFLQDRQTGNKCSILHRMNDSFVSVGLSCFVLFSRSGKSNMHKSDLEQVRAVQTAVKVRECEKISFQNVSWLSCQHFF